MDKWIMPATDFFRLFAHSPIRPFAYSLQPFSTGYWLLATGYSRRGFTLLEVLVASSILSIVLAILYGVFSQTLTSKRIAEDRSTLSRSARIVLLRIGEDLQGSFPFAPDDARFVGTTRRTSTFPQASLSFMSFANAQVTSVGREGDWSEIAYDLIPDPMAPMLWQLVRRVRLSADSSGSIRRDEQDGEVLPLLSRVQGLRVRFFDGRVWSDDWGKDRTKGRVPQAVEVELRLALAEKRGKRDMTPNDGVTFSTVVDLPLARPVGIDGQSGGSS